jgi:hypothetical protein
MEDLITNSYILFDENSGHRSPPLPPTPIGEPVPNFPYGTSHTKVATVAPGSLAYQKGSEDFTPQLPPRPTNSIHPSLRAGTSPTKDRKDTVPPLPPRLDQRTNDDAPVTSADPSLAHVDEETLTEGSTLNEHTSRAGSTTTSERGTVPPSPQATKSIITQLDIPSSSQLSTATATTQSSTPSSV